MDAWFDMSVSHTVRPPDGSVTPWQETETAIPGDIALWLLAHHNATLVPAVQARMFNP